jgi:hypothetical protein
MSCCIEDAADQDQPAEYRPRYRKTTVPAPPGRATGRGVLRLARVLRLRVVPLLMLTLIAGRENGRPLPLM